MKSNEYQCAICKGIFEKALTDEEAKEQLLNEFGDYNVEDCDLVCDDCYNEHFGHVTEKFDYKKTNIFDSTFTPKLFAEVYETMQKIIEENKDSWVDKHFKEYFDKFADYRSFGNEGFINLETMEVDENFKKCKEIEKDFLNSNKSYYSSWRNYSIFDKSKILIDK